MKQFTNEQVDDIIKLKFGSLVVAENSKSYVSNKILGKLFKVSGSKIRRLYLERFDKLQVQQLPLMERLQRLAQKRHGLVGVIDRRHLLDLCCGAYRVIAYPACGRGIGAHA